MITHIHELKIGGKYEPIMSHVHEWTSERGVHVHVCTSLCTNHECSGIKIENSEKYIPSGNESTNSSKVGLKNNINYDYMSHFSRFWISREKREKEWNSSRETRKKREKFYPIKWW